MTDRPTRSALRSAYRKAGTIAGVAGEFGVSFETARRWLHHAQVEVKPKGRPSRKADGLRASDLKRRYLNGESVAQLGRQYGVSPATVRTRLLDAGVELRPRPGWKY